MMTNPSVLRKLESGVFKIVVNNDKIHVPGREYNVHHLYVVGFHRANLKLYGSRVKGEIEYSGEPRINYDGDLLSVGFGREPKVVYMYDEELEITSDRVNGISTPLNLRIYEDGGHTVIVNEKHSFKGNEVHVNVVGSNSILNLLIYPMKIMWIYMPKASISIEKRDDVVMIMCSEN